MYVIQRPRLKIKRLSQIPVAKNVIGKSKRVLWRFGWWYPWQLKWLQRVAGWRGCKDQHWKRAVSTLSVAQCAVPEIWVLWAIEPQSGEMGEMQVRRRKWKEMQVRTLKTCLVGCAGEAGRWQGCEEAQPTHTRTCGFPRQNCSQLLCYDQCCSKSYFQLFHLFLFCSNGFALCLSCTREISSSSLYSYNSHSSHMAKRQNHSCRSPLHRSIAAFF